MNRMFPGGCVESWIAFHRTSDDALRAAGCDVKG